MLRYWQKKGPTSGETAKGGFKHRSAKGRLSKEERRNATCKKEEKKTSAGGKKEKAYQKKCS